VSHSVHFAKATSATSSNDVAIAKITSSIIECYLSHRNIERNLLPANIKEDEPWGYEVRDKRVIHTIAPVAHAEMRPLDIAAVRELSRDASFMRTPRCNRRYYPAALDVERSGRPCAERSDRTRRRYAKRTRRA